MSFEVGDRVRIPALQLDGVVLNVMKNGRYRVAIGDLVHQCKESELEVAASKPKLRPSSEHVQVTVRSSESQKRKLAEIDLHGLRVQEALLRVDQQLDRAILAQCSEVRVNHGIGTGAIREALHAHLATLKVVRAFKVEMANPGITRVFL